MDIADVESRMGRVRSHVRVILVWVSLSAVGTATAVVAYILDDREAALGLASLLLVVSPLSLAASLVVLWIQRDRIFELDGQLRRLRVRRRVNNRSVLDGGTSQPRHKVSRAQYLIETVEYAEESRSGATKNRRRHNVFQVIIILGSILVTSLTSVMAGANPLNWLTVVVSVTVAAAAGFSGFFKYRERGFNLQQTANAVEKETNAFELRIRDYPESMGEDEAMRKYAERIEEIKEEQRNRELQLEQSPDRSPQTAIGQQGNVPPAS